MTRKVSMFYCPVHGCDWKRVADTLDGGLLGSELAKHVLKYHPKLKNWVGFHKALEEARR